MVQIIFYSKFVTPDKDNTKSQQNTRWEIYVLMHQIKFLMFFQIIEILFVFSVVPPGLANLVNLEILNLFNNHLTELPISISQMPKLRILNLG